MAVRYHVQGGLVYSIELGRRRSSAKWVLDPGREIGTANPKGVTVWESLTTATPCHNVSHKSLNGPSPEAVAHKLGFAEVSHAIRPYYPQLFG
jgi:hypothetical protein